MAASQHGGYFGGRRIPIARGQKLLRFGNCFTGGSLLVDFLENEMVGFDENFTVAL